jgi:hypothetical protein
VAGKGAGLAALQPGYRITVTGTRIGTAYTASKIQAAPRPRTKPGPTPSSSTTAPAPAPSTQPSESVEPTTPSEPAEEPTANPSAT